MAFHQHHEGVQFPRNEHVDIVVRPVTLNADAPSDSLEYIEIREYIKASGTWGHGIVVPFGVMPDLKIALERVACTKKDSSQ